MVMPLLAVRSPIFLTDSNGFTSMHLAVHLGMSAVLRAIWDFNSVKMVMSCSSDALETPAFTAIRRNDLAIYKLLRGMDYHPERTNANGETCLHLAVDLGLSDFLAVS